MVRIDKEALQQCLNWGFDQTSLVAALKGRQSNRATVAYHLVVDNRTFDHHNDYLQMELGEVNAARLQHPSGIMGTIGDGPGCAACLLALFGDGSWLLYASTYVHSSRCGLNFSVLGCHGGVFFIGDFQISINTVRAISVSMSPQPWIFRTWRGFAVLLQVCISVPVQRSDCILCE